MAEDEKSKLCSCGTKVLELPLLCPDAGVLQACALFCSGGLSRGVCRAEPLGTLARGLQLRADQFELTGVLEEDCPEWDEQRHWLLCSLSLKPVLDCSLRAVMRTGLLYWELGGIS